MGSWVKVFSFKFVDRSGWLPGPSEDILVNIQTIWESLQLNILQVCIAVTISCKLYSVQQRIYISDRRVSPPLRCP